MLAQVARGTPAPRLRPRAAGGRRDRQAGAGDRAIPGRRGVPARPGARARGGRRHPPGVRRARFRHAAGDPRGRREGAEGRAHALRAPAGHPAAARGHRRALPPALRRRPCRPTRSSSPRARPRRCSCSSRRCSSGETRSCSRIPTTRAIRSSSSSPTGEPVYVPVDEDDAFQLRPEAVRARARAAHQGHRDQLARQSDGHGARARSHGRHRAPRAVDRLRRDLPRV